MIEENQLYSISEQIKLLRNSKKISLRELANRSEISPAMVSKIENRRTIPSLMTLVAIAKALDVEFFELVKNINKTHNEPYLLIKADDQKKINKEASMNYAINFIHSLDLNQFNHFEFNHLTIGTGAKRETVETEGHQYIYCLKGTLYFRINDVEIKIQKGDTLFFDGKHPHVPVNKSKSEVELLVIYLLI
jgi:transcriptional regulator with XRE-family HTH domain